MRVVVDTNIWVSAALNPTGHPAHITDAFEEGRFIVVTCEPQLLELEDVLSRPRIAARLSSPDAIGHLTAAIRMQAVVVPVTGRLHLCRDADDDAIIEAAVVGGADVLVTRDEDVSRDPDLTRVLETLGVRVLTVRRFIEELGGRPGTPRSS